MSRENVELVRRGWEAWLRGDLPALFATFHPDVVWDTSHFRDWPESAYHGREGVERFLNAWLEVRDAYEVGVDEMTATHDGRVLTLLWHRGRGRDSGVPLYLEMAQVATVDDGQVTRLDNYGDRDEAIAAAGLGSRS